MRNFRIYILFILSVLFFSCERIDDPEQFTAKEVKLYAKMGVHLSATDNTKGGTASTSLQIGLLRGDVSEGSSEYFTSESEVVTADVPVEGTLRTVSNFNPSQFYNNSTDEVVYTAWYPYIQDRYSSSTGTLTFPIPESGDSDIMYSSVVKGKMKTGFDVLQFEHALSKFNIHVYSSTEDPWCTMQSVSLNGLPDICTITLPFNARESHSINYSYSSPAQTTEDTGSSETTPQGITLSYDVSDNEISIPFGFDNKIKLGDGWIAAPASNGNTKFLNVSVNVVPITANNTGAQTQSTSQIVSVDVAGNFKPGYEYDIVLRFSDNNTVDAEVLVNDWVSSSDNINSDVNVSNTFYNLSANETANCYIVSSANFSYSFDATVKGNGNIAALPGSGIETKFSGENKPKTVGIIWMDNSVKDYFKLETTNVVEGKVLFHVVGKDSDKADKTDKTLQSEGNVLLGVYNSAGECIWTWHIWITDKPQKQNYTKGFIALDRNLGAIAPAPEGDSVDGMNGLFYQWGRPTPFSNNDVVDINNIAVSRTKIAERVTPDVAVANPLYFYSASTGVNIPGQTIPYYDWVSSDVSYVNGLWGFKGVEHEQVEKTIYDPCPVGYHVPYSRNWDNVKNYWVDSTVLWDNLKSLHLNIAGLDIYYPFQGYITKEGVYNKGHFHVGPTQSSYEGITIVEAWSALVNQHNTEDKGDDYPYRFLFSPEHKSLLTDSYSNRSRGLAVRCISDNTAAVVKDLSASQTANCYIVESDGYYKFKTTVRGNGVGSLLPLGGTVTAEINGGLSTVIDRDYIKKVDILWWQGDFTKDADFSTPGFVSNTAPDNMCITLLDGGIPCDEGYVSFKVSNFRQGNAVLAAYDDNDNILWTWHIWLTKKPEDKLSGIYTLMDRFLGATYAPDFSNVVPWNEDQQYYQEKLFTWNDKRRMAALGFYYQWGRKDPIIGPSAIWLDTDNTATVTSSSAQSSGWWKKDINNGSWSYMTTIPTRQAASIQEVVKDPTAFYKSVTTADDESGQWYPASFADGYTNVALWGYAVQDYSIEGQSFSKTMHDPCPPGYRTPFHHMWYYNSDSFYATQEWEGFTGLDWTEEPSYDYYGIVTKRTGFDNMWYPFAGMRNPITGGCELVGEKGHMHVGVPKGRSGIRTLWYNRTNSGHNEGGKGSAYGFSVRCMKE